MPYFRRPSREPQISYNSILAFLQKELSEKRVALSILLMDLLSQQAERRQQLLNTLTEMEKRRWIDEEVRVLSYIIIWYMPCIVFFVYSIYFF
jgi:ABC-type multidrug transport system permease subunit